jgi:hypothetical protein
VKYLFTCTNKNVDDFFDDAEILKSIRFRTFCLKKHSDQKYSPYKTLSKFELAQFVFGWSSVRHVQYACTKGKDIEAIDSKL